MTAHAHVVDDESMVTPSLDAGSGRPVREFEAICAKHSLPCGAPDNLAPFLGALAENKLLAMNFWSVVARLSDGRHGPALSQEQILAAIVQAVAGQSKDKAAEARHGEIAQLARMLAGEDVLAPHPPVSDEREPPASSPSPSAAADESPRNTRYATATQLHLHTAETEAAAPPEFASRSGRSRLVLTPDLSHPPIQPHQPPVDRQHAAIRSEPAYEPDEPRISIPLAAYAEGEGKRSAGARAGAVLLTLVLICGAAVFLLRGVTAWRQPGNTVQQAFTAFTRNTASAYTRVRDAIHNSSPASHAAITTQSAAPATSDAASAPIGGSEAAPEAGSGSDIAASTPDDGHNSAAPTGIPAAPVVPSSRSDASPSRPGSTSRTTSRPRAEEEAPSADDVARDAALVQVPGREMRNHLFASRFPIVPDAVNADALNGVVILRAVITARGTVEHAYAISGPEALRQPAIDAVSGWRYRPYMLNGSPIDVSTTIRVDFSGNL